MLRDVLAMLDRHGVFDLLGAEKTRALALAVLALGDAHDCNAGEVLEGLGPRLRICYYCRSCAEELEEGMCNKCRGKGA